MSKRGSSRKSAAKRARQRRPVQPDYSSLVVVSVLGRRRQGLAPRQIATVLLLGLIVFGGGWMWGTQTFNQSTLEVAAATHAGKRLAGNPASPDAPKTGLASSNHSDALHHFTPAPQKLGPPTAADIPIVMYHHTPSNFGEQLDGLLARGYTVISMATVYRALHGGPLPQKPVVITFDDGYSDQAQAYEALTARKLPATFYIINGGPVSRWCIGASRRYNDPLQPSGGCGDQYLSWEQIKTYDQSGLITIGAHTTDHLALANQTDAVQHAQIFDSKQDLETRLGHPVVDFAYPTGSYSDTTIQLVSEAGFKTAVTTNPGTAQGAGFDLTLKRIRFADSLP